MANIDIHRPHSLGLTKARLIARQWATQAQAKFDLTCHYEEGADSDQLSFSRPGVKGRLTVTPEHFEFQARLGLLLGAFKEKIENKILASLDKAMVQQPAGAGRQA